MTVRRLPLSPAASLRSQVVMRRQRSCGTAFVAAKAAFGSHAADFPAFRCDRSRDMVATGVKICAGPSAEQNAFAASAAVSKLMFAS